MTVRALRLAGGIVAYEPLQPTGRPKDALPWGAASVPREAVIVLLRVRSSFLLTASARPPGSAGRRMRHVPHWPAPSVRPA